MHPPNYRAYFNKDDLQLLALMATLLTIKQTMRYAKARLVSQFQLSALVRKSGNKLIVKVMELPEGSHLYQGQSFLHSALSKISHFRSTSRF